MDGGYAHGASYLGRGWQLMRQRPRLLLLGMVPALVVFVVLAAAFVLLLLNLGGVAAWVTPFADDWWTPLRAVVRLGAAVVLVVASVLLWIATFTALTLTVGDPFYEKIWRECEAMLGPTELGDGLGFWRSAVDGLKLTALGILTSLIVLLSGLLPVIGPVLGLLLGVTLSGRALGREVLSRPLEGRDLDRHAQRALLDPHRRAVHGYGVVTQLCFLVPLGGVLVMPVAVAGATAMARDILDGTPPPGWDDVKPQTGRPDSL
ncbi:EI24 domain-containing protein [Nocardioides marinquilinus]|uniref:EI24 domain-containing protein n=1 Tax=Nocardioides marinquilinus TaxID=1210400 RepID=A0ABP9PSM8_9ACTN